MNATFMNFVALMKIAEVKRKAINALPHGNFNKVTDAFYVVEQKKHENLFILCLTQIFFQTFH